MSVEKAPVICLENRFFDLLTHPAEIVVFTYITRAQGYGFHAMEICNNYGLSKIEVKNACRRLCEIGFLGKSSCDFFMFNVKRVKSRVVSRF